MSASPTSPPASGTTDAAVAIARRAVLPRRFGAWYVAEHNLRRLKNYGGTVVATAIGSPFLYLLAFGIGIGSLVVDDFGSSISGGDVSYLQFVAPALVCAAAVSVASEEFTYTIMMGFKWNPIYVGMNAAPISGRQIVDGVIIFVAIRMAITSAIYLAVVVAFGGVPLAAVGWVLLASVATGLGFGLPLMAYSASLKDDAGQFAMVMRFVVLPMTLFSGTMFPLQALPWFLHWIGWISPLWHGTELSRVASYGYQEPLWLSVVHVAFLVGAAVVGWRLAVRIATRRLDR
jgi:lipooligosaccharide transport system permease protein